VCLFVLGFSKLGRAHDPVAVGTCCLRVWRDMYLYKRIVLTGHTPVGNRRRGTESEIDAVSISAELNL
jgi:hypothetical protein